MQIFWLAFSCWILAFFINHESETRENEVSVIKTFWSERNAVRPFQNFEIFHDLNSTEMVLLKFSILKFSFSLPLPRLGSSTTAASIQNERPTTWNRSVVVIATFSLILSQHVASLLTRSGWRLEEVRLRLHSLDQNHGENSMGTDQNKRLWVAAVVERKLTRETGCYWMIDSKFGRW